MNPPVVVIGIGNPYRRDDGVGPAVIQRLRGAGLTGATLAESDGDVGTLITLWERRRLAVVVDAVYGHHGRPGRVHRHVMAGRPGGPARGTSSHTVDLGEAVALARELGRLPGRMVVLGVEVADVGYGLGLTPAVATAVERVVEQVVETVAAEVRSIAGAGA
ncbi:hydrogenase maturation protease [Dactylosporangium roseum]|uniref:Hydrogenase maturation protease n=1 Tax=Dactylosporangium roseum TaxID=47989 RepID=A0ABY5ZET5_9ACTN|nr:hydrogenase maturation protease [Dactylosporangium roseum]UWZ40096.1 hydrogenase maturation protease [Dactylosporangium roseum]